MLDCDQVPIGCKRQWIKKQLEIFSSVYVDPGKTKILQQTLYDLAVKSSGLYSQHKPRLVMSVLPYEDASTSTPMAVLVPLKTIFLASIFG
jgi:hypothetical protein